MIIDVDSMKFEVDVQDTLGTWHTRTIIAYSYDTDHGDLVFHEHFKERGTAYRYPMETFAKGTWRHVRRIF